MAAQLHTPPSMPPQVQEPAVTWGLCRIFDNTADAERSHLLLDFVAVHGLGAHPDHAWVRHRSLEDGVAKDVRWLTDLLPETLKQQQPSIRARIFCYNYQSAWIGPLCTTNRLRTVAQRLLSDLHLQRLQSGTSSDRPIIFLGHSFGGLVIEQAVVLASSVGSQYHDLLNSLGGIVLFGTPHRESVAQKYGSILAHLAQLVDYGEKIMIDEMKEDTFKVFDLTFDFQQIISRLRLHDAVVCFAENQKTDYSRRYQQRLGLLGNWLGSATSLMVVDAQSASLGGIELIQLDSDHLKLNKYRGFEDGNYATVASHVVRISSAAAAIVQQRRRDTAEMVKSYYEVHRHRTDKFVGRDAELEKILDHFSGPPPDRPRILIFCALGGQGKSQLALEYCHRTRSRYRGVFWITASTEALVVQSYRQILIRLRNYTSASVSQSQSMDEEEIVQLVKSVLDQWREQWLLVFDNYDNPQVFPMSRLRRFFPHGMSILGAGDIIITSRYRGLDRLGTILDVPPLPTHAGVELLLSGFQQNDVLDEHREIAITVVDRLGGLALAIDQASAYIRYQKLALERLTDFLQIYDQKRQIILKHTPAVEEQWEYTTLQFHGDADRDRAISAFTTWEMSFTQLGADHMPDQGDLTHFLTLSAFMAASENEEFIYEWYWIDCQNKKRPDWLRLFDTASDDSEDDSSSDKEMGGHLTGKAHPTHWSRDAFWRWINRLHKLSLVENVIPATEQVGARFKLHPLIRDWLQIREKKRDRIKQGAYAAEAFTILEVCAARCDDNDKSTLEQRTRLVKHIDNCLDRDRRICRSFSGPNDREVYYTGLAEFAAFYQSRGLFRQSEHVWRAILKLASEEKDRDHPYILSMTHHLANVLSHEDKYEEAEELYRVVLAIRERTLGKEDRLTLVSMISLAGVLADRGKYKEAEATYEEAISINEAAAGREDPLTLTLFNNLALLLVHQGRYADAEIMRRETLAIQERVLGREHRSTLQGMNNLATCLVERAQYEEAEKIHRQVLVIRERILGDDHPETLTSVNNLALTLRYLRRYQEAEEMYRQELTLVETKLGKEADLTLTVMNNLALTLSSQRKYAEAAEINRETLQIRESVLGPNHPLTMTSRSNLAMNLTWHGRFEEGERLARQVMDKHPSILGLGHPNTVTNITNLAINLQLQGRDEDRDGLVKEAIRIREEELGHDHPSILTLRGFLENRIPTANLRSLMVQ